MNKASLIYCLMMLALIAGLWVILHLGGNLQAPANLSGEWELLNPEAPDDGEEVQRMLLEQSGRFVRVTIEFRPTISLKLTSAAQPESHQPITFHGKDWTMTLSPEGEERYLLRLSGPEEYLWLAQRSQSEEENELQPTARATGAH